MKITNFLVTLLISVLAVVSISTVNDSPASEPQPMSEPIITRHESAPVMTSLAAMYAPAEDKDHWIDLVCAGMTQGGCEFFKTSLADQLWEEQAGHDGTSAGYIADGTTDIMENTQVWKASLTIIDGSADVTSDAFMLVERGEDGFWYLDRIIHGPGISN